MPFARMSATTACDVRRIHPGAAETRVAGHLRKRVLHAGGVVVRHHDVLEEVAPGRDGHGRGADAAGADDQDPHAVITSVPRVSPLVFVSGQAATSGSGWKASRRRWKNSGDLSLQSTRRMMPRMRKPIDSASGTPMPNKLAQVDASSGSVQV